MTYMGEREFNESQTPFAGFTREQWALYFISRYSGNDGEHHKDWVIDQVARILHGTPLVIKQARWTDGSAEWRVSTGTPAQKYDEWVAAQKQGEDGEDTYEYSTGTAP